MTRRIQTSGRNFVRSISNIPFLVISRYPETGLAPPVFEDSLNSKTFHGLDSAKPSADLYPTMIGQEDAFGYLAQNAFLRSTLNNKDLGLKSANWVHLKHDNPDATSLLKGSICRFISDLAHTNFPSNQRSEKIKFINSVLRRRQVTLVPLPLPYTTGIVAASSSEPYVTK